MSKEGEYDQHIAPLVAQVFALCTQYGINFVVDFELDDDPSTPTLPGEDRHLHCYSGLVSDDAGRRLRATLAAIDLWRVPARYVEGNDGEQGIGGKQ